MSTGVDLLQDPAGLLAADTARLLPGAATAGAQVRAIDTALAALPELDQPRALVVAGPRTTNETALLRALVGSAAAAPIVAVEQIPSWVGALDLVLVLAGEVHDPIAADAAEVAWRRGATVIVRAADGTPSPGSGTVMIPPQTAVSEALAAPARLALLIGIAHRCRLLSGPLDLPGLADTLDATALSCHPSAEEFVNPAVSLAEYLSDGTALLIGTDPVGDALAALAATALAELAGLPAAALPVNLALQSPALLRRAATGRDLFADPFADPMDGPPAARPVILAVSDLRAGQTLAAALPGAPMLEPPDQQNGPGPDPATAAVEELLRCTFAAVYLGLAAGQLPPMDAPDGLGRPGTSLGAVRPEERGAFAPTRNLEVGDDGDDDQLDDDFRRSIAGRPVDRTPDRDKGDEPGGFRPR